MRLTVHVPILRLPGLVILYVPVLCIVHACTSRVHTHTLCVLCLLMLPLRVVLYGILGVVTEHASLWVLAST